MALRYTRSANPQHGKLGENISLRRFVLFKLGKPNYTEASAKMTATEKSAA